MLAVLLLAARMGHGQGYSWESRTIKPGGVRWLTTYFGKIPSAEVGPRYALTPDLVAAVSQERKDSLSVLVPTDFQSIRPSGTRYIRLYLLNLTSHNIRLKHIDGELDEVMVVFRLDNQWVAPRYMELSYCGNGFWQSNLSPGFYLPIDMNVNDLYRGDIPVEYKVQFTVGRSVVESPVFTAKLTEMQMYFLRYSRVPLPDIY